MTPVSFTPPTAAFLPGDSTPKPKNAADAAKQFEAMLLSQVLSSAKPEDDGSGDKDATSDTLWDVAAQQFSQMLADRGGIGIAKLLKSSLPSTSKL